MWSSLQSAAVSAHASIIDALHRPLRWRMRRRKGRGGEDPFHDVARQFCRWVNGLDRPQVLEIGSRAVTGRTVRGAYPNAAAYVGFDIHPGPGVDVVGDAHRLASHFDAGRFDAVIAISTFEHLMFPWKVVLDVNRVLRVGGRVLVATHPVWPSHELPWDFWRFPAGGFTALFNGYTGFTIDRCEEGLPARAYSLVDDPATRGLAHAHLLKQGVSVVATKTGEYRSDLLRWDIAPAEVTATTYPLPAVDSGPADGSQQ